MAAAFSGVMPGALRAAHLVREDLDGEAAGTFPDFAPPMPSQTIMSTRSRPNGTIA